ncbi:STAS domain-containing protein [Fictibacillus enclensis]|uniref:STAS domain-containing protein n=1 Tax=Fictibacillus enclensis TaxID=1017270 RepID=UPI0025A146B0|nr:STAS domain-containing protein [Fictibacillus enclensis]MDM5335752.1 STAS domain-containing protein [Fictibacillus enclensis]
MLHIEKKESKNTVCFSISGVLDISTSDYFSEIVLQKVPLNEIVLDLSNLTFIDSTGIGVILELIYQVKERSASLQIIGMNKEIEEIFETIGVSRIMEALQRG